MEKAKNPPQEHSADDHYWFDRLDAAHAKNHDLPTQREAIAYFREKADPPGFLLKTEAGFDPGEAMYVPKSMWENILKALDKWIDREQVVRFFLQHLADTNWPGWGFAFKTLSAQGDRILPLLDNEIENNEGDSDLVGELKYLREELTSSS